MQILSNKIHLTNCNCYRQNTKYISIAIWHNNILRKKYNYGINIDFLVTYLTKIAAVGT